MAAAMNALSFILRIPVPSGSQQVGRVVSEVLYCDCVKRDCCLSTWCDVSLLSWKEDGALRLPVATGILSSP